MLQTDYVIGSPLNHQDPFIQRHGSQLTANEPPPFRQPFTSRRGIRLICLGVLELQCPNILTYLMNVSCMDDMKKLYCPLYLVVNYAPTPASPMHGETSHVQVKDPVCSVVTLLHGGSSCRFDSLYFNFRKCNIFVTKLSIYT